MANVFGGKGNGLLFGTGDEDTFFFTPAAEQGDLPAAPGDNKILGFQAGVDHIDLTALDVGGLEGVNWHRSGPNTIVTVDTIGNPANGPELVLTLLGVNAASLGGDDFLV